MESKQNLHIEGKVSKSCLRSLAEYQRFWSLVRPDRCSVVRITADEVVADRGDRRNGGIDSMPQSFRLWRATVNALSKPPE
jgi:hypothetical protein